MSFNQAKLIKSINQSSGIFDKFIYRPANSDTVADMLADGYFDKSRFINDPDWIGAIIDVEAYDKYATIRIGKDGKSVNVFSEVAEDTQKELVAFFTTVSAQNPTGLGDANKIKINFGAGGVSDNGEFNVGADGVVETLLNSTQYTIQLTMRISRTGGAGVAIVMARLMYAEDGIEGNAVQSGGTFGVKIDDADTIWREVVTFDFIPAVGSKFWFELARDDAGNNSGGLLSAQPTGTLLSAGWNPVASATLEIFKNSLA